MPNTCRFLPSTYAAIVECHGFNAHIAFFFISGVETDLEHYRNGAGFFGR